MSLARKPMSLARKEAKKAADGDGARELTGPTPQRRGRFEGYDVMSQRKYWDGVTTEVIEKRMEERRGLCFFSVAEAETAGALLDRLLAQDEAPKVPVLELVDARLEAGDIDGWRYQDLPEDRQAWRGSLAFLDEDAEARFGRRFAACGAEEQGELVQGIADADSWHGWPAQHVWSLWTRYACSAFYSHPYAWNEVGFGGPAYPRGYKVLRVGWREPWERPESDAEDPVEWGDRVEQARRTHEAQVGRRR